MKKVIPLALLLNIYSYANAEQMSADAFVAHMHEVQELSITPLADYCIKAVPDMASSVEAAKKNHIAVVDKVSPILGAELSEEALSTTEKAVKQLAKIKESSEKVLERIKKKPAKEFCQKFVSSLEKTNEENFLKRMRKSFAKYKK